MSKVIGVRAAPVNLNYVHTSPSKDEFLNQTPSRQWKSDKPGYGNYYESVPTNSQPQTNLSVYQSSTFYERPMRTTKTSCNTAKDDRIFNYPIPGGKSKGPLNPIKGWRKQLQPEQGKVTGKVSLDDVITNPGISSTVVNQDILCKDCKIISMSVNNKNLDYKFCESCFKNITNYLIKRNQSTDCCTQENSVVRNELSNFQPVQITGQPRIRRSASTVINKNYSTTNAEYLKNRNKTYDQRQTLSIIKGNSAADLGFPYPNLPPNSNNFVFPEPDQLNTGSANYYSTSCLNWNILDENKNIIGPENCEENKNQTVVIWKKSNRFYSNQGAVSQSQLIHNRNVISINNNYSNLREGMIPIYKGQPVNSIKLRGATPSGYKGVSPPYFIKNKYQAINFCMYRNRRNAACRISN